MKLDDLKHLPILEGGYVGEQEGKLGNIVEIVKLKWRWLVNEAGKPIPEYEEVVAILGLTEPGKYASSSGQIINQKHQYKPDEYRLVYYETEENPDGTFTSTRNVVSKLICCVLDYKMINKS